MKGYAIWRGTSGQSKLPTRSFDATPSFFLPPGKPLHARWVDRVEREIGSGTWWRVQVLINAVWRSGIQDLDIGGELCGMVPLELRWREGEGVHAASAVAASQSVYVLSFPSCASSSTACSGQQCAWLAVHRPVWQSFLFCMARLSVLRSPVCLDIDRRGMSNSPSLSAAVCL